MPIRGEPGEYRFDHRIRGDGSACFAVRVPAVRVTDEVMIEAGHDGEGRGAGPRAVDDIDDQCGRVAGLEPVELAVQHEHRSVHARPGAGPVLSLRLLVKRERAPVLGLTARADHP